jgi:hypothetical protein
MKSIDKKEMVIWLMTLVIVLIICCLLSLLWGKLVGTVAADLVNIT